MAERRMFAKSIVTSDSFLDMPLSTRCLYFSLAMLADDDGFVNNPRSIIRQVRASNDDFNLLLVRRFILAFESGVIVIKHWRIHNYIQKDRYKETKYLTEKSSLTLDEKGGYTEKKGGCIQNVSILDTQDRVRLGEVNTLSSNAPARVKLSEEERVKLEKHISPEDLQHYIEAIVVCEEKGKKYLNKTHYQAIVSMAKKDGRYDKLSEAHDKSYDLDEFYAAALAQAEEDMKKSKEEQEDGSTDSQ